MEHEPLSGSYDYMSVPIETKELGVVIPRAQCEAMMAAARLLSRIKMKGGDCPCDSCKALDEVPGILAVIRAAGIQIEGEGK